MRKTKRPAGAASAGPAQTNREQAANLSRHRARVNSAARQAVQDPDAKGIPLVLAHRHGRGQVRFWCELCRCWHFHGIDGDGDGSGHRLAHCHTDAGRAAYPRGYIIVEDGTDDDGGPA